MASIVICIFDVYRRWCGRRRWCAADVVGATLVLGIVGGKLAGDTRNAVVFLRRNTAEGVEDRTVVVSGEVVKSIGVPSLVAETLEVRIE